LSILSIDRYIDYLIYQGAITSELFLEFVRRKVLSYYTPYPGPRSVIVLDNISIYKSVQLQKLCKKQGVLLKFLLLYLPDYNLIEATFKNLKE
jgi:transposase